MIQRIRNSRTTRAISFLLALQLFLTGMDWDTPVYAGDGGPTQPEVHSFEPIGTDQMVDLFTGDFTYNIPLFNLPGPDGGYPINLAYHSGVQMDQEASWVGLGWNINMGTINRQIRNLPDDFGGGNEENITIKTDMKPNWTVGVGKSAITTPTTEVFGVDVSSLSSNVNYVKGLNIYYNNYRGIGYTADLGISLKTPKKTENSIRGDLGFNLKLDSQEGISGDVTAGISINGEKLKESVSVSTGFNNRTGWQRSLGIQTSTNKSISYGANLNFARTIVSVNIPNAMRGGSGSFSNGQGGNLFGVFNKKSTTIFFNTSYLKNKGRSVPYKGIGYMYYQNSPDSQFTPDNDNRIKDVARDNDGLIHKDTRRLASPTLSYDIYSVTGQGIGNMFRPVRADIGTVTTPKVNSEYHGGSLGIERLTIIATSTFQQRLGLDIGYNFSGSKTDFWPNANAAGYTFGATDASLTKSVYFKNYGELSSDDLVANYGASAASNKPVAYRLSNEDNFYNITNTDDKTGSAIQINTTRSSRRKRAIGVEAYTNGMIMDGSTSLLPEFNLRFYSTPSATGYNKLWTTLQGRKNYDEIRTNLSKTQVGGYMATNESGMRYVYGLPAQNQKERDVVFTVKENPNMLTSSQIASISQSGGKINYKQQGTDQYYNSVEKKAYAHSYLLTSILGLDYVDSDGTPGPTDGDLGYWVRFDYTKAHSNYRWRSPYSGAIYDKGYNSSLTDGKGHYSYGEKEIWYVATVETKTHIAEFIVSPRQDCKQVSIDEIAGNVGTGSYYQLDRIDVYAKSERYKNGSFNSSAKPVQSCHFTYDYSLCKKTPDNNGTDGKLTLKKVHFTYRNNISGVSRPYEFDYNTLVGSAEVEYSRDAVDRWGNYQPSANAANIDYPYNDPYTSKATMDERAALWNLKAINLPSGGRYEIDYESDSYAYVQDEVAMHLFQVTSLNKYTEEITGNIDYNPGNLSNPPGDEQRKVYFKLEQPIPTTTSATDKDKLMQKYIRPNEYLYFKVNINMRKHNKDPEYVGAYAQVKEIKVDESSVVGSNYVWGYVTLDKMKVNGQYTKHHPFTEAGSRHIRYNQPQLLYGNGPNMNLDDPTVSELKDIGASLIANATDIISTFTGFTTFLYGDGTSDYRLTDIEIGKSWIRLRTPDKVKYGGGHRVKQVRIIDNWATAFLSGGEATSTYGTVYEYDMVENGQTISSGVAAYEPLVGGDEIPLRNPVAGWEDQNIASKNMAQTYTEEPGNESLFPGPTVGYRQVKVLSLNTANKKNNTDPNIVHYGGVTVHEFYTAKDYPVITDQTELEQNKTFRKSRLIVPALIVNVDRLRMAASQGYYIELNDMHGKPKGAKEIAFTASGEEEISSVSYEYFDEAHLTTNRAGETFITRSLKNEVDVLYADVDATDANGNSDIHTSTLATEIEFIPETRYHQSRNISAGLDLNFEVTTTGFPLIYAIPTFNWQEEKTGTVVTNKIVSKAGIMKKVTATQRGSVAETENLVFDDVTGMPLLTSLTNDYGNKIYNYSILAKDQYDGAGGAYQNIGYSAVGTAVGTTATSGLQEVTFGSTDLANFAEGDVLLATPVTSGAKRICTLQTRKLNTNNLILETATALTGQYTFTVIRSGRRNLLTSPISSVTALSDPTKNRTAITCEDRGVKYPQYYPIYTIDNVLAINAVELGDKWYKGTRQLQSVPGTWYDNAFYSKGFGGAYAPVRSYAYIDNRFQTTSGATTTVNLETDGIMNDVPLFSWDNLLSTTSTPAGCVTKWREVDQVTLKNPSSFDIESRNILKTYSSKLYGRSGTEPIAVAGNARNSEIGSENFEEYAAGNIDISQNATNNLNFYKTVSSPSTPRYVEDRYDLVNGAQGKGYINIPVAKFTDASVVSIVVRLHFDRYKLTTPATDNPAEEVLVTIPAGSFSLHDATTTKLALTNALVNVPNADDRRFRGEVFIRRTLPTPAVTLNSSVQIMDGFAHTGTKSMGVEYTATGAKFMQGRLALDAGKEYQFSGWFGTRNNAMLLKSYNTLFVPLSVTAAFKVEFLNASGGLLSTQEYTEAEVMQGTFIDDWQKFTLNFTMPAGAVYVNIILPSSHEVYVASINDTEQVAYYDDLRLQPRDGAMETYVYNQENQRLEAQLDDNNYATFYYYDDEGNLFLVKRETEKGIITVQESRTYMIKQ